MRTTFHGLIVGLPKVKDGFDFIKTWVKRLSWSGAFIESRGTNIAVDVAEPFFENIINQQGLSDGHYL